MNMPRRIRDQSPLQAPGGANGPFSLKDPSLLRDKPPVIGHSTAECYRGHARHRNVQRDAQATMRALHSTATRSFVHEALHHVGQLLHRDGPRHPCFFLLFQVRSFLRLSTRCPCWHWTNLDDRQTKDRAGIHPQGGRPCVRINRLRRNLQPASQPESPTIRRTPVRLFGGSLLFFPAGSRCRMPVQGARTATMSRLIPPDLI